MSDKLQFVVAGKTGWWHVAGKAGLLAKAGDKLKFVGHSRAAA